MTFFSLIREQVEFWRIERAVRRAAEATCRQDLTID